MADTEKPSRRRSDDGSAQGPKVRILAVDDDHAYLRYLELILGRAGFDVAVAFDGMSAVDAIRRDPEIDILLVDLAMPLMDGIETVQKIQQEATGIYTILLTAHDGFETKLRALNSGCDDFLTKTTPESEIVAKLRSAARRLELERRLHVENEELERLAYTDELTGIANRRALFRAADEILAAGRKLSVVLFDLDDFKRVNDTYGHLMGDRILADVAGCLKKDTRYGDLIARYGGDEFVLLLPDTDEDEARRIAGRLHESVADLRWNTPSAVLRATASIGITSATDAARDIAALVAAADKRLYRAKDRRKTEAGLTPLPDLPRA
ncbi:MAG TPA: diguanylate cyclase [Thermoanaerobaculia bacterium]|nr:diguanylate cyclase [Thermoanaerobaculia bacterium]